MCFFSNTTLISSCIPLKSFLPSARQQMNRKNLRRGVGSTYLTSLAYTLFSFTYQTKPINLEREKCKSKNRSHPYFVAPWISLIKFVVMSFRFFFFIVVVVSSKCHRISISKMGKMSKIGGMYDKSHWILLSNVVVHSSKALQFSLSQTVSGFASGLFSQKSYFIYWQQRNKWIYTN